VVKGDHLYFSVGDFSVGQIPVSPPDFAAQDPSSPFGKVFDLDLTSKVTAVRSTGHRNPQGLVWTTSGTLMSTEHGPEGGDELNIIVPGGNYGWPYRTHGVGYGTFDWPAMPHVAARFTEPVFAWVPSPAISAVIEVAGFHDRWNGDLLVGSLKGQTLFRLNVTNSRVLYSEPIQVGSRIRDLVQMPNEIALMTDDPALVFIRVDEDRLKQNARLPETVRK
jgi:glucose/arabinose dehydrogenase